VRREDLGRYLQEEVKNWSSKSFGTLRDELRKGYERCDPGSLYHLEVTLLEDREDYVHVSLAVCSENVRWSCFNPLSASFIVYQDGRVDK
jgi:hypothetical protein